MLIRDSLVAQTHVAHLQNHVYSIVPFTFATANGGLTAHERIQLAVGPLDIAVEPYVLDDTPAVLSVGARIKQGFSFVWMHDKAPCFVRPDGVVIPLDTRGDIPYLKRHGKHREKPDRAREACGVEIVDHCIHVQRRLPSALAGCAVPATSDGADSVSDGEAPTLMPRGEVDSAMGSDAESEIGEALELAEAPLGEADNSTVVHCLTHKPARPRDCIDCMRAKTRNRRKLTWAFTRTVTAFGDLITMDHIHKRDLYQLPRCLFYPSAASEQLHRLPPRQSIHHFTH